MKRILLSLFLSVAVFTLSNLSVSAAETVLEVKPPTTLPKAGETFAITVDITGNPGLAAAQFTLSFDNALVECTDIKMGSVLRDMMGGSNPEHPDGAVVAAVSMSQVSGDGELATFYFTAKQPLSSWDFQLRDIVLDDGNGEEIQAKIVNPTTASQSVSPSNTISTPVPTPLPTPTSTATPSETQIPSPTPTIPPVSIPDPTPTFMPEGVEEGEGTQVTIAQSFTDLAGHWAETVVKEAAARRLFNGFPDGSFHPDENVTRAQFVTVLYRMAGSPETVEPPPFTDIDDQSAEFCAAIGWAYAAGYINGVTETSFAPTADLTREAAMKILFLYSGGVSGMEQMFTATYDTGFVDSGEISDWARAPMYWGYFNEIISGMGGDVLAPKGSATRAQLAKILVYYQDKIEQSGSVYLPYSRDA